MYKLDSEPSQEGIQSVIAATGCTASRAKVYLKTNQNDCLKAIAQIQNHRKSFSNLKNQAQSPSPPIKTPSLSSTSISEDGVGIDDLPEPQQARRPSSPRTRINNARGPTSPNHFEERRSPPPPKPNHLLAERRSPQPSPRSLEERRSPPPKPNHVEERKSPQPKPRNIDERRTPPPSVGEDEQAYPTPLSVRSIPAEQNAQPEKEAQADPVTLNRSKSSANGDTHKEAFVLEVQPPVADSSIWDFRLPILIPPATLQPSDQPGSQAFSIVDLVAAIQNGVPTAHVRQYLSHHTLVAPQRVREIINAEVNGFPAIFYVVSANNEAIVRLFVQAGGDVNATYGMPAIPLLAFAVVNSRTIGRDTTYTIATLLSLGANADVIPTPFYHLFHQDLPLDGPNEQSLFAELQDPRKAWCQPFAMRRLITERLNLTQRYYFHRSSKLAKPTGRQRDVAARNDATALFGIPYFLIGQSAAMELLTQSFLHAMLRRQKQPLVLVFAGPSGHGKTELARQLGSLLSLDLHVGDCTAVSREDELFGPRKPYAGAEEGAPLNNFLAAHDGKKCIVFLDEFEKTTGDIWNTLLLPFDKGEYQDRRTLRTINCMNTIWILATNSLDDRITGFCARNPAIYDEGNKSRRNDLLEELTMQMKNDFVVKFSPPLTGRITSFIPFLPFSIPETLVCAHKYLLELITDVSYPICTTPGSLEHLIGNVQLKIRNDASVCGVLTKDYDAGLGARSLRKAVTDRVASLLDNEYLATHDVICEGVGVEEYLVFLVDGRIKVRRGEGGCFG